MWQLPALQPEEIICYLRKSRTDDPLLTVAEVLSKHEQMLNEWVDRNLPGLGPVPEENRYREVVSGETIESRPEIQKVLKRTESPRIKAILTVEPQRLSRGDLEDIGRLVKLLRYSNTIVITMQYTYDLQDERDRDSFERELKRGNEFLEYQKRIMNNGRLLSVKNGNFLGRKPPYGYKKIEIKEGKRKILTLEPDPETAPVVKLIFELYRDGYGRTRIADKLDAMGIPAPLGKSWSPRTLRDILYNEHYIGKVVWKKRGEIRKVVDGDVVISRPVAAEYFVGDGNHPAIIEQELWDAVQAKRGTIPPAKKQTSLLNPLAGLLYCRTCGKAMGRRSYPNPDGSDRTPPRVICPNQRQCKSASAKLDDVLEEVVKVLRSTIADFEIKIEQGTDDSVEIHRQMIERMEKRLRELRELEIAQWDEKTKGGMPAHVFERLNGETLREIEEVKLALYEANDALPEPESLQDKVTTFHAALDTLLNPEAPVREKNILLKQCIERIDYHREQLNNGYRPRDGQEAPIELDFHLRV